MGKKYSTTEAMVDEDDTYLNLAGLQRIETNRAGGSWGDGLYVRIATQA